MSSSNHNNIPVSTSSLAQAWLAQDRDAETRATISTLVEINHTAELERRLRHRMAFGTAGLRAPLDSGFAFMNSLTILQTAQGLVKYVMQQNASKKPEEMNGIAIGFDGRRHSAKFARHTATVFLNAGFKNVYLFPDVVPTPFVPFAIRKYNLDVGVMVTASHNPKDDNGYKVYWSTGAQIVSPHDSGIAKCIEECLDVSAEQWDLDETKILSKTLNKTAEVSHDFFESMKSLMVGDGHANDGSSSSSSALNTPIVYTAMHGVGTPFALRAMRDVARMTNVIPVLDQCFPDSYFRTVDFPNPEEGKSSLNLAIKTAEDENNKADIILANDPDADRLAAAERNVSGSGWKIFTGNEIGALLGWWLFRKATQVDKKKPENLCMLSSTVSSGILRSIARKEGNYFEETLTGFKFMGTRTQEIESANPTKEVIFAFEEAIGFMCGNRVRDKDGVTAAAVFCDMIQHQKTKEGKTWTLQAQLNSIYQQYGMHVSLNSYVISKDPTHTAAMFEAWRNGGKYTETVGGSKVVSIRDLSTGYDSSREDKKAILPLSKSSPMITCELENGVRFTVRASGTEPKVKFYTEIVSEAGSSKSREEIQKVLEGSVQAILNEIMKPKEFGFIERSSG